MPVDTPTQARIADSAITQTPPPSPTPPETASPASTTDIPVRRVSFEQPLDGLERHFATDQNIVMSHLIAALSGLFPPGEQFFIRSVREYRSQIQDPVLKRQVSNFIGQEVVHGREHEELNDRLDELGYTTHKISKVLDKVLNLLTRHQAPEENLSATAAIEHFTAVLGEVALKTELKDDIAHEGLRQLFVWHALEECEHKAVCFDVYQQCVGDERRRIRTMKIVRPMFMSRVIYYTLKGVLRDPASRERGRLWRDLKAARNMSLLSRDVWQALREYDEPGFHPNDRSTDVLVAQFREQLFGDDGELTEFVAGSVRRQSK